MNMNNRFKSEDEKPKPKQELPKGDDAKCALLYSLLVKDMVKQGVDADLADAMATTVVEDILEETQIVRQAARLRYKIYSTVYYNQLGDDLMEDPNDLMNYDPEDVSAIFPEN